MTEPYEKLIQQKTEKYLALCLQNQGKWVHFSKDDCGRHRQHVFNRVRDILKMMSIPFARSTPFPAGETDYGYPLKIKTLDAEQARELSQSLAQRRRDNRLHAQLRFNEEATTLPLPTGHEFSDSDVD